ncbi:TetR/AcrR family transcriptional regulator [Tomitella cavernea]|uniref:TetR/AcrR family transcriptional regulator n=1 Tax=Tomitella cavernea TaxID=1387982 RepID=A0ABP9CPY1_9ACTN|nr:TetR/AcrR family transcriptional regulator [Tomitella cavernea]
MGRKSRTGGPEADAAAPQSGRLGVDDWTTAALALLVEDGVAAVKISTLCARLGVTKGSFYWHFADLRSLIAATADHWCGRQNDAVRGLDDLESVPVDERLGVMSRMLLAEGSWTVERAIRDWARTNEQIAESVRVLDRRIFDVVEATMRELGFDEQDARLRAGVMVYAGVGFIHARGNLPAPEGADIDRLIAMVTARP